ARWQRSAQPGLALLCLAQGQKNNARTIIVSVLDELKELGSRAKALDASVEIMLAVDEVAAAKTAATELRSIARHYDAAQLHAMSARANGAVLLAEGDAKGALNVLRQSWEIWSDLDAPYEAARTRVLIGCACRASSDCDAAKLELELAHEVFQKLGATAD